MGELNTNITYYCSKGVDELTNPLPGYLPDMVSDAYLTRHCCEVGTYWDPGDGQCVEADPCYSLIEPETYDCHFDFLNESEFLNWTLDVYNPDPDCVWQDNSPMQACCPINIYSEETYDFIDVTYYEYEG